MELSGTENNDGGSALSDEYIILQRDTYSLLLRTIVDAESTIENLQEGERELLKQKNIFEDAFLNAAMDVLKVKVEKETLTLVLMEAQKINEQSTRTRKKLLILLAILFGHLAYDAGMKFTASRSQVADPNVATSHDSHESFIPSLESSARINRD